MGMTRKRLLFFVVLVALGALSRSASGRAEDAERGQIWRDIFARPPQASSPRMEVHEKVRVRLGSRLFRDKRLSGREDRSCASCHRPDRGFTDGLAKGVGADGKPLDRNTPHLFGAGWSSSYFWDGRSPTLEAQARVPITMANELGGEFSTIVTRLKADPDMARDFAAAFPGDPIISEDNLLAAIAAYERTLIPPETRFDDWVRGSGDALTDIEKRGLRLFVGKAGCVSCHGGWRLTDDSFHDIGLKSLDRGRGDIDPALGGIPAFKTPSLREITRTSPYMHDGSLATLDDVLEHYAGGLEKRPSLSPNIVPDLDLDEGERRALIAFLKTLSSESGIESPSPVLSPKP